MRSNVFQDIAQYSRVHTRGMAADHWLYSCEGRSIPAMEYSESCAILLLCLLLPLCPLHVLLEGVVDHRQLLEGVVDHKQLLAGVVDRGQLLEGVVEHEQLLAGVIHHGLLLAGGVRHELLLARLGLYTTRLGLYAMNCCWLGWGCTPSFVRQDLLLARLSFTPRGWGCTPRPAAG